MEATHQLDDSGRRVQMVPGWRLRQILTREGKSLERPPWFSDDDDWDVGDGDE